MKIEIVRDGKPLASAEGSKEVYLVYKEAYREGDKIRLTVKEAGFITLQLDAVLGRSVLYTNGAPFEMSIPFGQRHECYQDMAFKGESHYLWARCAYEWEYRAYRNLSLNPYDCHENTSLFPHAFANIETRGESVFAARNAIDGLVASNDHGRWPWTSWGINRDPEAKLTLEFGREVRADRIVLYLRADFPHDAWWTEGLITFSSGRELKLKLEKKDGPQVFTFEEEAFTSLSLDHLIKADDPSPFPALSQLEVYGK